MSFFSTVAATCLVIPQIYANSNFTIKPTAGQPFPTSIFSGETVSAYYTVINNTSSTRSGYQVSGLPSYVIQNTSGAGSCGNPVTLIADGSCTLRLDIRSPIKSSFALCKGTSCTKASVPLNITSPSFPSGPALRVTVGAYQQSKSLSYVPLVYTSHNSGASWKLNNTDLPLPADTAIGNKKTRRTDEYCLR